jgi:hypothetical protein
VTRRLELSGADFARWPRAAREETARLEKKLDAAQRLTATLHAELDASARQRQSEAVARAQLQVWFLAGCLLDFACRFMNLSRGASRYRILPGFPPQQCRCQIPAKSPCSEDSLSEVWLSLCCGE